MRATLKYFCYWHLKKKKNSFKNKKILSFEKHLDFCLQIKIVSFKTTNNYILVSKKLSFRKCFLSKNLFVSKTFCFCFENA